MQDSSKPKTRFDLVSGGFGQIVGGVINFMLGIAALFFWRDLGLSLLAFGGILICWGAWRMFSGAQAPQKEIRCPHCGEGNTMLADAREFVCFNCQKPLKLVRR